MPGLEPGRELGRELGRLKLSEGGMGQPMLLTSLDSVGSGGLEASAAVAKESTVLTLSELSVRLCCRFRSISLSRSGVSGVGGGKMPDSGLKCSSGPGFAVDADETESLSSLEELLCCRP